MLLSKTNKNELHTRKKESKIEQKCTKICFRYFEIFLVNSNIRRALLTSVLKARRTFMILKNFRRPCSVFVVLTIQEAENRG